jgi:outer membrane protein assembly factor BamB
MGGANGWSLFRVDPATGDVLWQRSPYPSNGMSPPSVGPDGSVYFSRSLGYLDSVTPAGQPRWTFFDGAIVDHPAVSPDGSVVVAGYRPDFGQPGSVRGWNAATGTPAWAGVGIRCRSSMRWRRARAGRLPRPRPGAWYPGSSA